MKKNGWRNLILGVVLMALLAGLAVPAFAATGKKQINVEYVDIKLTVDGVPAPIGRVFVSEGTTYLPVRAVSEALYKEVKWDGPTHTIYISDPAEPNTADANSTYDDGSYYHSGKETLNVDYSNIKLVVDGKEVTPKDANGKVVEPFAYNGTTYLPVRAVGEALGKKVRWDGKTKTVHLGEMPQATYLVDVCKVANRGSDYICRAADHQSFTMIDGKRYSQGFSSDSLHIAFELGGKYESLTFDLSATPSSRWTTQSRRPVTGYLEVYLDGELAQKIEVTKDSGVQKVTVPLNYAQIVRFKDTDDDSTRDCVDLLVANAVLSGERAAPAKPVPPANATYLVDVCETSYIGKYKAAENKYFEDAFGNKYTNGFEVNSTATGTVDLNGQYKTLKATVFSDYYFAKRCKFYVDGELVGEVIHGEYVSKTIEIPLNYGMKLTIENDYSSTNYDVFFADAILE